MKLREKGALDPLLIVAVVVTLVIGGFVLYRITDSDDSVTYDDETISEASDAKQDEEATEDPADEVDTEDEWTDDQSDDSLLTYTNDTYGFSFQYPDNDKLLLNASEGAVEEDQSIVSLKYDCGPNCGFVFDMSLDAVDPVSVEDWKNQFADNSVYSLASETEVQFGTVSGTQLVFSPVGEPNIDDVVHVVANQIADTYQIKINLNGSTSDDFDITGEGLKVLDTLTFN